MLLLIPFNLTFEILISSLGDPLSLILLNLWGVLRSIGSNAAVAAAVAVAVSAGIAAAAVDDVPHYCKVSHVHKNLVIFTQSYYCICLVSI